MTNTATLFDLIKLVLKGGGGLRSTLWLAVFEEALGLALTTASPFLLKRIVDRMGDLRAPELIVLAAGFVVSWITPTVLSALKAPKTTRLVDHLYRHILTRLLQVQLPRLAKGQGAELDSGRVGGVAERLPLSLQVVLDGLVWRTAPLIAQLAVSLVALALSLPLRYAALLAVTIAAYAALSQRGVTRHMREVEAFNATASGLSAELGDVLRNAERVVCNGALAMEVERIDLSAIRRYRAQRRLSGSIVGSAILQFIALALGLSIVLCIAILDAKAGKLRVGDFVLLQAFALRLALPVGGMILTLRQTAVSLANIGEAIELGSGAVEPPSVSPMDHKENDHLSLDRVSYTHPGGGGVTEASASLAGDQMVALVGASGSGKSTLARLMAGMLTPAEGVVHVGGRSLLSISPAARPDAVLYVPQFIGLFNRTLGENGRYPPSELDDATLAERLRDWAFDGVESVNLAASAGERGSHLSGGQVQKLELARLCAIDASVMILDESTSALDGPSETRILRELRARTAGRLLVVVTHRERLAASADQVLWIAGGRIAATGRHETLLEIAAYRELWMSE